jgi:hypothetical protein
MTRIAVRALLALAAMAFVALLFVPPSALAPEAAAPAEPSPGRCRLRLSGPVAGDYPCTSEVEVREGRFALAIATPEGSRARVTLRAELEEVDGELVQAAGTAARAVVREPEHAGLGNVWTRGEDLAADVSDGGLAHLKLAVSPAPVNPDRRPLRLEVELVLPAPGAMASRSTPATD